MKDIEPKGGWQFGRDHLQPLPPGDPLPSNLELHRGRVSSLVLHRMDQFDQEVAVGFEGNIREEFLRRTDTSSGRGIDANNLDPRLRAHFDTNQFFFTQRDSEGEPTTGYGIEWSNGMLIPKLIHQTDESTYILTVTGQTQAAYDQVEIRTFQDGNDVNRTIRTFVPNRLDPEAPDHPLVIVMDRDGPWDKDRVEMTYDGIDPEGNVRLATLQTTPEGNSFIPYPDQEDNLITVEGHQFPITTNIYTELEAMTAGHFVSH